MKKLVLVKACFEDEKPTCKNCSLLDECDCDDLYCRASELGCRDYKPNHECPVHHSEPSRLVDEAIHACKRLINGGGIDSAAIYEVEEIVKILNQVKGL